MQISLCVIKSFTSLLINIPLEQFFLHSANTIVHMVTPKLFYPNSRVNASANFFSVRIISLWNRLPAGLVQVDNLIKFKSLLRSLDLSFCTAW